ncbi:MAG: fibronectin type III domain-containing protein [Candidatus Marinimicrobia bacterium]|nr:fibronectin type III domain-containing protein [Candidatus Neomarinimicrobiota bacterium]
MKIIHLYSLLFIAVLLSCSDRERLNPLDYKNPLTEGKPTGFRIITNRDTVRLFWDHPAIEDLTGFQIFQSMGDGDLILSDSIDNTQVTLMKTGFMYDTTYQFALKTKTRFGESKLSDPISVVPGPVNIWIADILGNMIWRLSYDGSNVLKQHIIFNPTAIEYERETLWVANYYEKKIIAMDRQLIPKKEIILSDRPVDLAFNSDEKYLYVLQTDSIINGYTTEGLLQIQIKLDASFSLYSRLAYDGKTHSIWVTNFLHNLVIHVELKNDPIRITRFSDLNKPFSVEPDPISGGVWVSTNNGIIRFQNDNTQTQFKEGMYISDISINPVNGDCYYAGKSLSSDLWETGYLPSIHPEESVQLLGNAVPDISNIKVIPGSGNPGFMIHQYRTGKILRFNPEGILIGEMETFDNFLDIEID